MAECEWALLCDHAFQDVGRKTCVIGIFDRIFSVNVPAQHHHAAFVFKVTGDALEELVFKLEIVRPSGGTLGGFGGKIKLPPTGTSDVIMNLQGLPLPDWGVYTFSLHFNDEPVKNVGLTVSKRSAPKGPPRSKETH